MWLLLFLTSIIIGQSLCCIPCDPKGKEAMDRFRSLLNSQVDQKVESFVHMKRFAKTAEHQVLKYLEDEVQLLDQYAITDIVSEYKKAIDIIEETHFKEIQLLAMIEMQFQRLQVRLKEIVQDSKKRRCPNKQGANSCGLMIQTYTRCSTCIDEKIICAGGLPQNQEFFDRCRCLCNIERCVDMISGRSCSPCKNDVEYFTSTLDCGDRHIKVMEDEDLILDCNFEWHARLEDNYKNTLFKRGEIKAIHTKEPYVEIKGVQMENAGVYKCVTTMENAVPVNNIVFHVTVLPGLERTRVPYTARPTLPDVLDITASEPPRIEVKELSSLDLTPLYVAGAATVLLIASICLCMCCWKKARKPLEREPV